MTLATTLADLKASLDQGNEALTTKHFRLLIELFEGLRIDISASGNMSVGDPVEVNRVDLYGVNGMRAHVGVTNEFEVFAGTVDAKDNLLRTAGTVRGGAFDFGSGQVSWTAGSGSPEGVVTAPVGSLYSRTNGGAGTSLYVKESGVSNTGWVAK